MATCEYWPHCVGGGQYCWNKCINPQPIDDTVQALVVATKNMAKKQYRKHIRKRHIRFMMSRTEHDENHSINPDDYNHIHEEPDAGEN